MMTPAKPTNGYICHVPGCDSWSDDCLLCEVHRRGFRRLTKYLQKSILISLSNIVCQRSYSEELDRFQCYHCEGWFTREEVCPDHFPVTKGHDVTLKFCPDRCVTSCKNCNRSDNPKRKDGLSPEETTRI